MRKNVHKLNSYNIIHKMVASRHLVYKICNGFKLLIVMAKSKPFSRHLHKEPWPVHWVVNVWWSTGIHRHFTTNLPSFHPVKVKVTEVHHIHYHFTFISLPFIPLTTKWIRIASFEWVFVSWMTMWTTLDDFRRQLWMDDTDGLWMKFGRWKFGWILGWINFGRYFWNE